MRAVLIPRQLRPPLATILALAGAAMLLAWSAVPAEAAVVTRTVSKSPAEALAFWTQQRMQAAEPLDIPSADGATVAASPRTAAGSSPAGRVVKIHSTPGKALAADFEPGAETSFPNRVHGRVFFTFPGLPGLFSCSGTVIASLHRNVVFTAGHCVYDVETQQAADQWIFVPGYRDGEAPYGTFAATTLLGTEEYSTTGDMNFDVAIAQMAVPLEDQLGARGVAFNKAPRTSYKIFGYPAEPAPTYNGERLIQCDAPFYALELALTHPFSTVAYPCNMTQGASGGGWVNPGGYVVSVSSHVYIDPSLDDRIAGPYFGEVVKRLYNKAGGSAECPPAKQALTKAKKREKTARKADKRRDSKKTAKSLRKASKRLSKAQNKRDAVC